MALPLPLAVPVILPAGATATVHTYVVPETLLLSAIDVELPEHTLCAEGVAEATGIGLTRIEAVNGIPAQPLAAGVIVYVAVPELLPVADNVCEIVVPDPAEAPDTPD